MRFLLGLAVGSLATYVYCNRTPVIVPSAPLPLRIPGTNVVVDLHTTDQIYGGGAGAPGNAAATPY